MNVVSVQAHNVRSWEDVDLTIPTGATAILGSNGSGKSTLLLAIEVGLFCDRGELATMLRDGTDDCSVCVTVEHAGEVYRVRRNYSKGKTTCDFERCNEVRVENGIAHLDDTIPTTEAWSPLTLASIAETDALICQTLGLTRETFRASAFLGQGARAFASKDTTPKQRMALFSALLGLGVYEKLAARAHDERVTVEREAETVRARRTDALARAAGRDEYELVAAMNAETARSAGEALAAAQKRRDALAAAMTEAQEKSQAVGAAQSALTAAEAEHRRLHDVTLAAEDARKALGTLGPETARLGALVSRIPGLEGIWRDLREQDETYKRRLSECRASVRASEDAEQRLLDLDRRATALVDEAHALEQKAVRALEHLGEPCDRCQRPLGAEDAQRAAQSYRVEASATLGQAEILRSEAATIVIPLVEEPPTDRPSSEALTAAEQNLRVARSAERDLAALTERQRTLEERVAKADSPDYRDTLTRARRACDVARIDLDAKRAAAPTPEQAMRIKMDRLAADAECNQAQQALTHATAEKARADERLAQIATAEQEAAALGHRETTLNDRAILLAACEKAHGRNGVPALILENRVPAIEAAATDLLAALGGNTAGARVELRTQREKKTGGTEDRLDVVLVTADGYDRGYDSWSTGERCRIDVALAKAILPSFEFLTIDDPPGLDTEGKAALIETIDALLERGGLSTVLVVSQEAELRDSFAQIVELETRGGRSVVAGARELEGAAA